MSQKLIVHAAINNLSIGNVGYNILKELFLRKIHVSFFPRQFDLSAFNVSPEFKIWLENSINNRFVKFNKDIPSLCCWHINGSEAKFSDKQYLFSFHETDSPQPAEVNIVNQQEHTFFSSRWTVENFERYEAERVSFVPLGFDPDLKISEKRIISSDVTNWLIGPCKFEQRKCTQQVIELWIKKYGGNLKHQLTIAVNNPFFRKDANGFDTNDILNSIFKGQMPANINPITQYLKTNFEINSLLNGADINLSGISASEGWGLSQFNSAALGKQVIVTNVTAHKDWATPENSILIEENGMKPVYDGIFFHPNQPFNQGNYFKFDDDNIVAAFEKAEKVAHNVNVEGLKLKEKFTYKHTVDKLLEVINKE